MLGLAFGLGGIAYVGIEQLVERLQSTRDGGEDRTSMWMIYIAVALDLFSDGLMIGAASAVATGLGMLLALGQVMADLPEGFATVANLKHKEVPRRKRLLLSAAFAIPVLLAATLAFLLLREQDTALQMSALVFTAGLLTVASVEDMISEAHESAEDRPGSVLALVGGFVLFTRRASAVAGQERPE